MSLPSTYYVTAIYLLSHCHLLTMSLPSTFSLPSTYYVTAIYLLSHYLLTLSLPFTYSLTAFLLSLLSTYSIAVIYLLLHYYLLTFCHIFTLSLSYLTLTVIYLLCGCHLSILLSTYSLAVTYSLSHCGVLILCVSPTYSHCHLYTWRHPLTIHFDLTFSQGTAPAAPHDASGLGLRPVIVCRRHQHLVTCTQSMRHTVYVQS